MIGIILAGGQGLRLRPLTQDTPKALVEVNGKTIIEHQLDYISLTVSKAIIACGYMSNKIVSKLGSSYHDMTLEYSEETNQLGTGGALKLSISKHLQEDIALVINGDIFTTADLNAMIAFHKQGQFPVTMLLVPYHSSYGIVEIDKLRTVRKFDEKPEFTDIWINGGIYIIDVLRLYKKLPDIGDMETQTFVQMARQAEIQAFIHYGFWKSVDTFKDLQSVSDEIRSGQQL